MFPIFAVDIGGGCDGRTITVTIQDPKKVPKVGEFFVLAVYVNKAGQLREARNLMEQF
jgi:hypothetical protein